MLETFQERKEDVPELQFNKGSIHPYSKPVEDTQEKKSAVNIPGENMKDEKFFNKILMTIDLVTERSEKVIIYHDPSEIPSGWGWFNAKPNVNQHDIPLN